jgi:hypothetical protein
MNIAQVPAFNKSLPVLPEALQIEAKKLLGIPNQRVSGSFKLITALALPGERQHPLPDNHVMKELHQLIAK